MDSDTNSVSFLMAELQSSFLFDGTTLPEMFVYSYRGAAQISRACWLHQQKNLGGTMGRKIQIVSYDDEEKTVIGEADIDNYEKVTITITDESLINQTTESESNAMGI